uniref:Peptidase MA superfamily n=1 Tax=Candidatus Kentrum eta TaxID=2126337 RepID=A0A450V945_9GAMM|nr:MAG: Peptidase MA superfamily [Candidatus Kentron sp. H]VFJ94031.1 MAG: Peptidase MA superfamily [Candidatus Kentron sp. H]VFK01237.1 MAG: Peptidase MA superfamily [Candidatus Kentron sp. H]
MPRLKSLKPKHLKPLLAIFLALFLLPPAHGAVRHGLTVTLDPASHHLAVEDRISLPHAENTSFNNRPRPMEPHEDKLPCAALDDSTSDEFPTGARTLTFTLHANLPVTLEGPPDARLEVLEKAPDSNPAQNVPLRHYRVTLGGDQRALTLRYAGEIHHPVTQFGDEYARGFRETPGLIAQEGVFLAGSSHWYPLFQGHRFVTFELETHLPPGWESVSQGKQIRREASVSGNTVGWAESAPQEEVYLIAAPFHVYAQSAGPVPAYVYLREPDEALARRYLDATGHYIGIYRRLIGPYPYAKFALVENFWETGYGMPSFTLLGSKVIRLPFILHSSYPHEILHNWWGNGVYVDYERGNWAEGLTAYLADHRIKEKRGQGVGHRRRILQHYTDFVDANEDFPLTEFRARHGQVTEAVGYGKAQMLFHMLRRKMGEAAFEQALGRLFARFKFKSADYGALASVFGQAAGTDLSAFFAQWVERTGAPQLAVSFVSTEPLDDGFRLRAQIHQIQLGEAYVLDIPLSISLAGDGKPLETTLAMSGKHLEVRLDLPKRPVLLAVDPGFDLFRRLHRQEIPPALSQAFGVDKALMVVPDGGEDDGALEGYRSLAGTWARARENDARGNDVRVAVESETDALPADRAVWLFGWRNRFLPVMARALARYDVALDTHGVVIDGKTFTRSRHAVVMAARHPDNPHQALIWVGAEDPDALPGLARKLPHYRSYSFLAFTGHGPHNVLKGQWPVDRSPMRMAIPSPFRQRARLRKAATPVRPLPNGRRRSMKGA